MANGTYNNPRAGTNSSKNRMKSMMNKVNDPKKSTLDKSDKISQDYEYDLFEDTIFKPQDYEKNLKKYCISTGISIPVYSPSKDRIQDKQTI